MIKTPRWDWWQFDYRIKPQPAPIPMTIPWKVSMNNQKPDVNQKPDW